MAIVRAGATFEHFATGTDETTTEHTPSDVPTFVTVATYSCCFGAVANTVTYGGSSMTREITADEMWRYCAIWSLASPLDGAQDVVVSWSSTFSGKAVGIQTYTGGGLIDQTESNQGTAKVSTLDISSVSGAMVFDAIIVSATFGWAEGADQTVLWEDATAAPECAASTEDGDTTVTMSWEFFPVNPTEFVHLAVNILVGAGGLAGGGNSEVDGDLPTAPGGGGWTGTAPALRPFPPGSKIEPYPFFKTAYELQQILKNIRIV